jgi:hypothetical protein
LDKKGAKSSNRNRYILKSSSNENIRKVEPNKERSEAIYEIVNRVWTDVMSQAMKYLDEEIMEEIIIDCTCRTMINTFSRSIYKENQRKYPATQKGGNQVVYD